MKRYVAWCLVVLASTCAQASATIYFSDDAEGQVVGGFNAGGPAAVGAWSTYSWGGDIQVVDVGGSHGKVFYMGGTGDWLNADLTGPAQGPVRVSYDLQPIYGEIGYGYNYQYMINTQQGWAEYGTAVSFSKAWDANPAVIGAGSAPSVEVPYSQYAHQWFHVDLTLPAVDEGHPLSSYDVTVTREATGEVVYQQTGVAASVPASGALWGYTSYSFTGGGSETYMYIDNVQIVPEPATMLLLVGGVLGLIRRK